MATQRGERTPESSFSRKLHHPWRNIMAPPISQGCQEKLLSESHLWPEPWEISELITWTMNQVVDHWPLIVVACLTYTPWKTTALPKIHPNSKEKYHLNHPPPWLWRYQNVFIHFPGCVQSLSCFVCSSSCFQKKTAFCWAPQRFLFFLFHLLLCFLGFFQTRLCGRRIKLQQPKSIPRKRANYANYACKWRFSKNTLRKHQVGPLGWNKNCPKIMSFWGKHRTLSLRIGLWSLLPNGRFVAPINGGGPNYLQVLAWPPTSNLPLLLSLPPIFT